MNIAFVSFHSGKVNRGVETYVHEVANRLKSLGNSVTVYQSGSVLPGSRYRVSVMSGFPFLWNLKVFFKLPKTTQIVVATNGRSQVLLMKLWSLLCGKKLVIPGQSGPGADDKWNLWCRPNAFIALTHHQGEWAAQITSNVHIEVIPNGVDMDKFTPVGSKINHSLPSPVVLNVAALEEIKRQEALIKAVSRTDASLLIVGEGSLKNRLQLLGNKYLPGRFAILSFSHSDMPKVYRAANVFAYPSQPWESFGIAVIEAMASGVPVVVTDDPIRRELVGETGGEVVNPENSVKFAKLLEKVISRKSHYAPRRQASHFEWDVIARQYHSLFAKLLAA